MKDGNFKEVILKVDIEGLEAIYFDSGHGNIFFGPATKSQSYSFLSAVVAFLSLTFYAIKTDYLWLIPVALIAVVAIGNKWWDLVSDTLKWKRSAVKFIEHCRQVSFLAIRYNQDMIVHVQDNETIKIHWKDFTEAEMNKRYISLKYPERSIFLPKSSFPENEYAELCEVIFKNVTNVLREDQ